MSNIGIIFIIQNKKSSILSHHELINAKKKLSLFLVIFVCILKNSLIRDLKNQLAEKCKLLDDLKEIESNLKNAQSKHSMKILFENQKEKILKIQNDFHQQHEKMKIKLLKFEQNFKNQFTKFEKNWINWNTDDIIDWINCLEHP